MTLHGRLAKHLDTHRSYRVVGVVEGGFLVGVLGRDGRGLEVVVLPVAQRRVQQRPMPKERQPGGRGCPVRRGTSVAARGDQAAASSLVGVTAMVASRAARSAGKCR